MDRTHDSDQPDLEVIFDLALNVGPQKVAVEARTVFVLSEQEYLELLARSSEEDESRPDVQERPDST